MDSRTTEAFWINFFFLSSMVRYFVVLFLLWSTSPRPVINITVFFFAPGSPVRSLPSIWLTSNSCKCYVVVSTGCTRDTKHRKRSFTDVIDVAKIRAFSLCFCIFALMQTNAVLRLYSSEKIASRDRFLSWFLVIFWFIIIAQRSNSLLVA